MRPRLFTFDVFGTIVDWREGLRASLAPLGCALDDAAFERVIDRQASLERRGPFRPYAEIVAASLVQVAGIAPDDAARIGAGAGNWPLFADAAEGLRLLLDRAPCVATTNSDRSHGDQVQGQLGYRLTAWICAEELRCYKPSPEFWRATAARVGAATDRSWWHVSAYADYDLDAARSLGLTCVSIPRPHHRPGSAHRTDADLLALALSLGD